MSETKRINNIELPVNVGDSVTVINQFGEIVKCTVVSIAINCNKKGEWNKKFRVVEITDEKDPWQNDYSFSDIGDVVFC